jgi:hypothetical protein
MNPVRVRKLLTIALACGLALTSMNLFAQQAPARVPVGPPVSPGYQPFSLPTGPLPLVSPQSPSPLNVVHIGQSFEGIDFNGSNCGCLPPDTNAAVGNGFVVETVNVQIRVFDTLGTVLLDEPLSTFFGAASGGDPYVVYDDIAGRWYVSAFDTNDTGLFLAVSNDANPLDGFLTYDLTAVGGFPDYNKLGYNKDAIFISFNDFGSNGGFARIASINKAAILLGTLTYYVNTPANQFRAMPPAQMHGDTKGGVEWFVSTDGTDAGGTTMRVTKMTNYLSNSATFAYTSLPVTQYQSATTADQPGGPGTVTTFPNTTTTQVQFHKGRLITAMSSALAGDGFVYPKALFYIINVSRPTPTLLKQGAIDRGPGVALQMASAEQDSKGHLALTWIESSLTEYLSMWVGNGQRAKAAAPGLGFFFFSFRIGDYSSIVLDPSDNVTFWAANEYIGADGASDIWRTHITSFTEQ